MNPQHTLARIAQVAKKIRQMEEELRDLKKVRLKLKGEIVKPRKKT